MAEQEDAKPASGRFNTNDETKRIVWTQTAGHCELCGTDLTFDYRAGKPMKCKRPSYTVLQLKS